MYTLYMKRTSGFWVLVLLFFGAALISFGINQAHQLTKKSGLPKTAVEGAKTELQTVKTVLDGDTVVLTGGDTVRLIGINAPEKNQPNFLEAKNKLESLVLGKSVELDYDIQGKDQYGRVLVYMHAGDIFVNLEMVKSGFAVVETVQPDSLHAEELTTAQKDARANCLGMWQGMCHQNVSACVQLASIHQSAQPVLAPDSLNNEWVELVNTCSSSQNMQGYLVKDASASNAYTFKNLDIASKKSIKLHSGCGTYSSADVYWQCPERPVPVWNNSGDSAYLYDASGKLVSQIEY